MKYAAPIFQNKKTNTKKNARNEKNLLEIREVGKKTCGKPYTPRLNSSGVIQLFSGRGGGGGWAGGIGGGSKASLGLKRDKRLKTI